MQPGTARWVHGLQRAVAQGERMGCSDQEPDPHTKAEAPDHPDHPPPCINHPAYYPPTLCHILLGAPALRGWVDGARAGDPALKRLPCALQVCVCVCVCVCCVLRCCVCVRVC